MLPFMYKAGRDGGPRSITVYLDRKPYTLLSSAPLFLAVLNAIKAGDEAAVRRAVEVKKSLVTSPDGKFQLFDDTLVYDGVQLGQKMFDRIAAVFREGLDITPIVNFLQNLHANPSQASRDELYLFLEHNNLPITEDGHFLAYKYILGEYKDCYTGSMDNGIGKIVSMPRDKVNPDRNQTCSTGLHFCSRGYIGDMDGSNGYRLVVLKINPADVVSIPAEYGLAKGRTCKYLVLEEITFADHLPDDYRQTTPSTYNPDEEPDGVVDELEEELCEDCGLPLEDCFCDAGDDDEGNGSPAPSTKRSGGLDERKVAEIRKALASSEFKSGDWTYTHIGKSLGVHRSTVQRIHAGYTHNK